MKNASGRLYIRRYESSDCAALCEIEEGIKHARWSRENISEAAQHSLNTLLVAVMKEDEGHPALHTQEIEAETVVGYICFRILFEELYIQKVAVKKRFRRQGIATRLMKQALELGTGQGAERCVLETDIENGAALLLYQRMGFTPVSKKRKSQRQVTMIKPL